MSPDGRWVVLTSHGMNRIFPTDGGPSQPIPGVAQGEVVLCWTGDSGGLYVFRRGEVPAHIYRVDITTGNRRLWKTLGPLDRAGVRLVYYALVAADGRSYAYTFDRAQEDLYLVKGLK